jgi:hypothetical protein
MEDKKTKKQAPNVSTKIGIKPVPKVSDFLKTSRFSGKPNRFAGKFNPSQFHTQHKGGGGA